MPTLISGRIGSGGGSGGSSRRKKNALAGCGGYGAPIILHQTDAPSVDPIGGFGTGATQLADTLSPLCGITAARGFTATSGLSGAPIGPGSDCGAFGSVGGYAGVPGPPPIGTLQQANTLGIMWETARNELAYVTCGAGDWIINQRACGGLAAGTNAVWTDAYIFLVDVDGAIKHTIGHKSVGAAGPFVDGQSEIYTMVVAGKSVLLFPTDRIVILLVFSYYWNGASPGNNYDPARGCCVGVDCTGSGSGSGSDPTYPMFFGPQLANDQLIITPMYNVRAVYPALKLRDGSGSGSGRRRALYGIVRGCGEYKMGIKARGATAATGSGPGSGRKRAKAGIGDCCPPFHVGSGSGSGGDFFVYGGGGGPGDGGGPETPADFSGCTVAGYPGAVYLTLPNGFLPPSGNALGDRTNYCCECPQSSVTIPLYWRAIAPCPIYPFVPGDDYNFTNSWLGWFINPHAWYHYDPATGIGLTLCERDNGGGVLGTPTLTSYVMYVRLEPCSPIIDVVPDAGNFRLSFWYGVVRSLEQLAGWTNNSNSLSSIALPHLDLVFPPVGIAPGPIATLATVTA